MRVVRGLPNSWEPITATAFDQDIEDDTTWSPCNKFLAVVKPELEAAEILDAVTLERLNTFQSPDPSVQWWLSFSTDSRLLTQFSGRSLTSWDLQTGGLVGTIQSGLNESSLDPFSSTYSTDGGMVAIAQKIRSSHDDGDDGDDDDDYEDYDSDDDDDYEDYDGDEDEDDDSRDHGAFITTYNLLSRTYACSYRISESQGRIITPIWTHGECIRFATVTPGSITTWEIAFTQAHPPTEVESLPAPDRVVDGKDFLFLPTLSRLAFILRGTISVWDAKASNLLLKSGPKLASDFTWTSDLPYFSSGGSFSSDGCFYACTAGDEIYVWKESLSSYLLHQKLSTVTLDARPHFSPSGESIALSIDEKIRVWPTRDQNLSLASFPTQDKDDLAGFSLAFSPDQKLAAFGRTYGSVVTVIDLESGDPRLIVDAGMEMWCLGVVGDTIVVVSDKKIVTWHVPARNHTLGTRANLNDSVRTVTFARPPRSRKTLHRQPTDVAISLDLCRIATATDHKKSRGVRLEVYDTSTGRCLAATTTISLMELQFAVDGHEVWGEDDDTLPKGWEITQDDESGRLELEPLEPTACPSGVFLWQSSCGYEVTDDGWVLSSTRKRLLWLPHHWRSYEKYRVWNGRFLGLVYEELPEAVILEFIE